MKNLMVLFLLLVAYTSAGQHSFKKFEDDKTGTTTFKGRMTLADIYREPSFDWMRNGVDEYKPAQPAIDVLKAKLRQYHLIVFMGTWCGDSQDLMPKLYKVLDKAGYPLTDITLYGVDRDKATGTGEDKTYGMTLVPTIIVMDGKREAGRITESIDNSMEEDLAAIVNKDKGHRERH